MPRVSTALTPRTLVMLALPLVSCTGGSSDPDPMSTSLSAGSVTLGGSDDSGSGDTGTNPGTSASDDDPTSPTTSASSVDEDTGPDDTADTGNDDGPLDCTGDVLETLPIDSSGWIPRECTVFDIQGAWYCFDDGMTDTSCAANTPPYENNGMCLSGTALGPVMGAWGGGLGVSLNETGGAMSVKEAYDAAGHGVLGFSVEISGDTGGNELRLGFTGSAAPSGVSPFVPLPGAGSYDVMIADALVPESWMLPESGTSPDPSAIYDVQLQIAADGTAGPFDFCITNLTPILEEGGGNNEPPPPYGAPVCSQFGTISLTNQYLIQNNVWNGAVPGSGGSQCVSALWDGASDVAGFVAEPSFDLGTPEPGSYPSIVYGWHYDADVPGSYSPEAVSTINAIPSQWEWDVPAAGQYNVSYDLWIHPNASATSPNGGLELMIWTATRGVQPIGTNQGYTVDFEGATWEVWYGSPGGWNTVTYRRTTNTSAVDMDLMPFVEHAVMEGYAQNWWSLLGVEAGFEIWEGYQPMTTSWYHVSVQ